MLNAKLGEQLGLLNKWPSCECKKNLYMDIKSAIPVNTQMKWKQISFVVSMEKVLAVWMEDQTSTTFH